MTVKHIKHDGGLAALQKKADDYAKTKIKTGWFDSNRYEDGTPVAQVAKIQNDGAVIRNKKTGKTIEIPSRPFFTDAINNNKENIKDRYIKDFKGYIKNKRNKEASLRRTSNYIEGLVKKQIVNGGYKPNSPDTVEKKGFNKPLVDTGIMLQTISSKMDES